MDETYVRINSPKAWLLASRPKTLTGAAVPVMLGAALAVADSGVQVRVLPMLLCFLFAFIMQVDANFVNDYFDFVRGNDDDTRLGPKRACAQGWISAKAMRVGIGITTVAACCVGLPLVAYGGWSLVIVGALCVVFCFLYTTSLSYIGMGDVLVLVFFGLVPVTLTYMLSMPAFSFCAPGRVVMASLSCGLVIDALLVVNNYRDIDNDRRAGKRTLVVMMGRRCTEAFYLALGVLACAINVVAFRRYGIVAMLMPCLYLVPHALTFRRMKAIGRGRELNAVLGMTARNIFVFGLLTALGLLI